MVARNAMEPPGKIPVERIAEPKHQTACPPDIVFVDQEIKIIRRTQEGNSVEALGEQGPLEETHAIFSSAKASINRLRAARR